MAKSNHRNLIGQRFGRLVVEGRSAVRTSHGRVKWRCRCDCGELKEVRVDVLTKGISQSCGCLRKEQMSRRAKSHGQSFTRLYRIWISMIQRCHNPNTANYHLYGGRDIKVCDQWNSFETFAKDMGQPPSSRHSIDRYPNKNGNYEPSNARWATQTEQIRNRRTTVWLTIDGITDVLVNWMPRSPVHITTVMARRCNGWSDKAALLTPPYAPP